MKRGRRIERFFHSFFWVLYITVPFEKDRREGMQGEGGGGRREYANRIGIN